MDVSDFQFSDVFAVSESAIADHGALNVSLIRDVPLLSIRSCSLTVKNQSTSFYIDS